MLFGAGGLKPAAPLDAAIAPLDESGSDVRSATDMRDSGERRT
jgi:hypothetical protein